METTIVLIIILLAITIAPIISKYKDYREGFPVVFKKVQFLL